MFQTHFTCYDPTSEHRGYLSIDELKDVLQLTNEKHLNVIVMFASWTYNNLDLVGVATFPWDKHVRGVRGGTVVQVNIETTMSSCVLLCISFIAYISLTWLVE